MKTALTSPFQLGKLESNPLKKDKAYKQGSKMN